MTAAISPQLAPILETEGLDPEALPGIEYRTKLIKDRDLNRPGYRGGQLV